MLQKVAPVRIFEQAVVQVRQLILNGALAAGEKLPTEQELSRQLNVSRSSVREALRVLEAEGLVEVRRGSGTFVSDNPVPSGPTVDVAHWLELREEALEQVLQVREYVEGLAAALAAQHATVESLEELRSIMTQQEELTCALEGDEQAGFDVLARLDAAFHLAVSNAGGNDIANEIISHIIPAFNETNKAVLYLKRRASRMGVEHERILAALEAHDPAQAEQAMRAHILQVKREIMNL